MTKSQRNVLTAIKGLPARYRHNGVTGCPVRFDAVECYDGRTIRSLVRNGWLIYSDYGVQVTNSGLLALKKED